MKFAKGDTIVCTKRHSLGVVREITEARDTGYSWRYPDNPDAGEWDTENSNDPLLELGWEAKRND